MFPKTEYIFKNYVILENFYLISRPYLIHVRITRIVYDLITLAVLFVVIGAMIMDIFSDSGFGFRIFKGLAGFELLCLTFSARYRKITSKSIERLEETCQLNEECLSILYIKGNNIAVISLVSFIIDIIGLKLLKVKNTATILLCVAFAAHEAELGYFALLFETMNARLGMLKDATPNIGSKRYGHLLIATSNLSEQCTPLLLLLLSSTLLSTVSFQFILILADAETIVWLSLYLAWRETRSMYSLWIMCKSVAKSSIICKDLSLHLIGKIVLDKNLSKEKNPSQYKVLRRWYSVLVTQQPQYISSSILNIGLSTPVLLLDLSINYLLIIVQMYLAYK